MHWLSSIFTGLGFLAFVGGFLIETIFQQQALFLISIVFLLLSIVNQMEYNVNRAKQQLHELESMGETLESIDSWLKYLATAERRKQQATKDRSS